MVASFKKHTLNFINPGGTSRGVLHTKDSWFIMLSNKPNGEQVGIGECSIIPKLSIDDVPELEQVIAETIEELNFRFQISNFKLACTELRQLIFNFQFSIFNYPALRFALETALLDLENGGVRTLFPSAFTRGEASIPINGLIWMGDFNAMWQQAEQKTKDGFSVLKMKIGALDFDEEMYFVAQLRKHFPQIELRLDANGGFPLEEALERLQALSQFNIHSVEQPIKQKNISQMAKLCKRSPVDIALDEELIGVETRHATSLLQAIKPQYIILKPSLLGGFRACEEWSSTAEQQGIRWWATSALESNIGLNAIAQWVFTKNNPLPQGLGTGGVFANNVKMPLQVEQGNLKCRI